LAEQEFSLSTAIVFGASLCKKSWIQNRNTHAVQAETQKLGHSDLDQGLCATASDANLTPAGPNLR